MQILLGIILVLAGIIVLLLLTGFFLKKDYSVGKDIVINKPKATVFDFLKYLKNQNKFSVWGSMDAGMKTEFRGTDGKDGWQ